MQAAKANGRRPRRPAGTPAARSEPILPDAVVVSAELAEVINQPVAAADLSDLRRLQRAAVHAAEAIFAGDAMATLPICAKRRRRAGI
jgi:hypothetical protein